MRCIGRRGVQCLPSPATVRRAPRDDSDHTTSSTLAFTLPVVILLVGIDAPRARPPPGAPPGHPPPGAPAPGAPAPGAPPACDDPGGGGHVCVRAARCGNVGVCCACRYRGVVAQIEIESKV